MLNKTVCLTLLLLLCSLTCLAQKTGRSPEAPADQSPLVQAGDRLAEQRKWPEAIETYNRAIRLEPRNVEAYIRLGDAFMGSGNWSEALRAYKQAVSVAPGDADAQYALGDAYNTMGQHGDAFAPLVRAIQIDPEFAEAHYGIGYAYLRGSQFEKALPYLRGAIRLQADYADAHYSLALAYLNLDNANGLEEERRKLAALDADLSAKLEKEIKTFDRDASRAAAQTAALARKSAGTQPVVPDPPRPASVPPANRNQRTARRTKTDNKAAFELTFWETIKDSTDPEDFKAYLEKYPQGKFADQARAHSGPQSKGCSGELYGEWETTLGRLIISKAEGKLVSGSYAQLNGTFKGELLADKLIISGQWKDDSGAGEINLQLKGDHKNLVGTLYGDTPRIIRGQCLERSAAGRP